MNEHGDLPGTHTRRRLAVLMLIVLIAGAVSASDFARDNIQWLLDTARPVMAAHPILGKLIFVILSVVSAIVAFFSSAIIVPAAVYAWGEWTTFLLLWLAWLAGGTCTYFIGRTLGRKMFTWLIDRRHVESYSRIITAKSQFLTVVLFQLALPSEVPGYVLGAARYSFVRYISVLAVLELPYAIGAVFLADSFVRGRYGTFAAIAFAALVVTAIAVRRFQSEMHRAAAQNAL